MLVNLSFHIFLTCVMFIGGITQTRNASICQAVSKHAITWKTKLSISYLCVCVHVSSYKRVMLYRHFHQNVKFRPKKSTFLFTLNISFAFSSDHEDKTSSLLEKKKSISEEPQKLFFPKMVSQKMFYMLVLFLRLTYGIVL